MVWREVPIVDGGYADDTRSFSVQETINYIPEYGTQQGTRTTGKLRGAPGWTGAFVDTGTGLPIRGAHNAEGVFLVVSGTKLYQINTNGTATLRGTIPGIARCSMDHNQITGGFEVAISNGSSGYVYNTATQTLSQITSSNFLGAKCFAYADQYILGVEPGGRFAFTSQPADALTYSDLDRYEAEGAPDLIIGQVVTHREWWLMGARTIEPFVDTGATTNTWARAQGMVIERGVASTFAMAALDNTVFWVGDDGVVYRANGYTPMRISTMPVEQALAKCNLSLCFVFTMESEGHKIFYITCPDGHTWGYDVATQKWHRRQSKDLQRWRLNTLTNWNGGWYGGDFSNGQIYKLDWNVPREGTDAMASERITGYLSMEFNRIAVLGIAPMFDTGGISPVTPLSMTGKIANGIVGQTLSGAYVGAGGEMPYTFSIIAGALPPGITLNPNGTYSGTLTTAGSYSWTVHLADAQGNYVNFNDSNVVVTQLTITGTLPNGTQGTAYSASLTAVGGQPPYSSWRITAGTLPLGLSINASTGVISGTPT